MSNMKTCRYCGLRDDRNSICMLHNKKINVDKDFCSWRVAQPFHCERCNRITLSPIFRKNDGEEICHTYCEECINVV